MRITNINNKYLQFIVLASAYIAVTMMVLIIYGCPPGPKQLPPTQYYGLLAFDDPGSPPSGIEVHYAAAVPIKWMYEYRYEEANPIKTLGLETDFLFFHKFDYWAEWKARATFQDRYPQYPWSDSYKWMVQYGVLDMPNSLMFYGQGGKYIEPHSDSENPIHTHPQSVTSQSLKGFDAATVVLTGWRFSFFSKDHHLDRVGIRITDVSYDPSEGKISWNVQGTFLDKNADDAYTWTYYYLIIAFNDGEVQSKTITYAFSGISPAFEYCSDAPTPVSGDRHRRWKVVLPQGWFVNLKLGDAEVNHLSYKLYNRDVYNESDLPLSANNEICYGLEMKFPDPIRVRFDNETAARWDVVFLSFDNGGYREYPPEEWFTGDRGWISEWMPYTGFGQQSHLFHTWVQSAYQ